MKNKLDTLHHVAVRHSAFGYKGDLDFSGGLESRSLTTKAQVRRVLRIGGHVFNGYRQCEDFCDWAMYTATNVEGLIPKARAVGSFSPLTVDGLAIFLPNSGMVAAFEGAPHEPIEARA